MLKGGGWHPLTTTYHWPLPLLNVIAYVPQMEYIPRGRLFQVIIVCLTKGTFYVLRFSWWIVFHIKMKILFCTYSIWLIIEFPIDWQKKESWDIIVFENWINWKSLYTNHIKILCQWIIIPKMSSKRIEWWRDFFQPGTLFYLYWRLATCRGVLNCPLIEV